MKSKNKKLLFAKNSTSLKQIDEELEVSDEMDSSEEEQEEV